MYNVTVSVFNQENIQSYESDKNHIEINLKRKDVPQRGSGSSVPSHLNETSFSNSISQTEQNSNTSTQKNQDRDYLSAVERGDMETAQRMVDEAAERAFADSKVRDEDGKVIPLSERFKTDNADIRYQDRENPYTYEKLNGKPDMRITTIDDSQNHTPNAQTRKDIVSQAIKNAASVGKYDKDGHAVVFVGDINSEVMLPKSALRHGLDRRLNINAPVVLKAGEILKNAIAVNELIPRNRETTNTFTLVGIAKNQNNEPYTATFIVNRSTNEVMSMDVLYSLNTKTEPAGSLSPGAYANARYLTGSTVSIADLLDYVNKYFPDILPESVLRHYGYESRPEGKIGSSALYQDRTDASFSKIET